MAEVRLIDGNALKEDFMNDYHNYMMESLRGNYHNVIRITEVIERIKDAPTIEAETDNDWINTKDRLPDPFIHVLCYMKDGCVDGCVIGYHNGFRWILDIACIDTRCITHWQPVPKPPKGE